MRKALIPLLAWFFLSAVNSLVGLTIASRITDRLNRTFYYLSRIFRNMK